MGIRMSMEKWLMLASEVQRLNFSEQTEKEFLENREQLIAFGLKSGIIKENQILGIENILREIYAINLEVWRFNRARFYEYISALNELEVQNITLQPDFLDVSTDLEMQSESEWTSSEESCPLEVKYFKILTKVYTDGTFRVFSEDECLHLEDLENANFILSLQLKILSNEIVLQKNEAFLKNFRGVFPSKEEILSPKFPKVVIPTQEIRLSQLIKDVRMKYEPLQVQDLTLSRKLSADKKYYEKI